MSSDKDNAETQDGTRAVVSTIKDVKDRQGTSQGGSIRMAVVVAGGGALLMLVIISAVLYCSSSSSTFSFRTKQEYDAIASLHPDDRDESVMIKSEQDHRAQQHLRSSTNQSTTMISDEQRHRMAESRSYYNDLTLQVTEDQRNRLKHQNHISYSSKWSIAELVGTHNSYNSWNDDKAAYGWPNQKASMRMQMDGGIRLLNADLHEQYTKVFGIGLPIKTGRFLMCHDSALGGNLCSGIERKWRHFLEELRDRLNKDSFKREFFVIDIQDYTGKDKKVVETMNDYIGKWLFRPKDMSSSDCRFPINDDRYTRSRLLAQGYQVVAITGEQDDSSCSQHNKFREYVFSLKMYVDKGGDGTMVDRDTSLYKNKRAYVVYEDRQFSNKASEHVSDTDVTKMLQNQGYNMLGLDFIFYLDDKGKERFENLLWSWASSQPKTGSCVAGTCNYGCAAVPSTKKWKAYHCGDEFYAACSKSQGSEKPPLWKLTRSKHSWYDAFDACKNDVGAKGYKFDHPKNGYEQYQLLDARTAAGVSGSSVWLRYHYSNKDYWTGDIATSGGQSLVRVYNKWAPDQPDVDCKLVSVLPIKFECSNRCAYVAGSGASSDEKDKWKVGPCSKESYKAACYKQGSGWKISNKFTNFEDSFYACAALGDGWSFAVPKDAVEHSNLIKARNNAGYSRGVWIRFHFSTKDEMTSEMYYVEGSAVKPLLADATYMKAANDMKCRYDGGFRLFRTPDNDPYTIGECRDKCESTPGCAIFTLGDADHSNTNHRGLCMGCKESGLEKGNGFESYFLLSHYGW